MVTLQDNDWEIKYAKIDSGSYLWKEEHVKKIENAEIHIYLKEIIKGSDAWKTAIDSKFSVFVGSKTALYGLVTKRFLTSSFKKYKKNNDVKFWGVHFGFDLLEDALEFIEMLKEKFEENKDAYKLK